ncbi:MAG TPA: acyl-CoA thioesterase [Synechococcales cyanobacterium M55_K2018_004]|nr:acyl-CoA thioesterase [Synechococcales cyanobacterium M55_K2018_004]
MPFTYHRTIRFSDTDAAGVVFFANILTICHEAYEASLSAAGINASDFFCYPRIAIPITHTTVDFTRPLFCGDDVRVYVTPKQLKDSEFEVAYDLFTVETTGDEITSVQEFPAARGFTKHVCIDSASRTRTQIPPNVMHWLEQWGKSLGNPIELL